MNTKQPRLELWVDVFDVVKQRASVSPKCMPTQLIGAVLSEFRADVPYLGAIPAHYRLLRADTLSPLDADAALGQQLRSGERLIVCENDVVLPPGTQPPVQPIYLREDHTGRVYALRWLPAVIGRSSAEEPEADRLAVDLAAYPAGARVARRHVRLLEENGQWWVELLKANPVSLVQADDHVVDLSPGVRQAIHEGDVILFVRSDIRLRFVVRPVT